MGELFYNTLFSAEVKSELEKNGGRIKTICIHSNCDHIPWEMIVLPEAPHFEEPRPDEFLAHRYEVTRWVDGYRAPESIRARDLKLVVPHYPRGEELKCADQEVAYLEGLSGIVATQVPPKSLDVIKALSGGEFDVFHFSGHGEQTGVKTKISSLRLEPSQGYQESTDGPQREPEYIKPDMLRGRKKKWKQRRPLIFLNACKTGLADTGLLHPSGWADAALSSMAGAFVGTLWSVEDAAAFLFAKTFYDNLFQDRTIGESALAARRVVEKAGHPSWLSYVVYAQPNAKLIPLAAPVTKTEATHGE